MGFGAGAFTVVLATGLRSRLPVTATSSSLTDPLVVVALPASILSFPAAIAVEPRRFTAPEVALKALARAAALGSRVPDSHLPIIACQRPRPEKTVRAMVSP